MNLKTLLSNQLVTPPVSANILAGITRDCVIKLAQKELGLRVQEKNITVAELKSADEVFLTGTGAEIAPVGLIDKKIINRRKIDPVTRMLSDLYHQIVRGEMAKYKRWLAPVH